jgi:hypothetical protein
MWAASCRSTRALQGGGGEPLTRKLMPRPFHPRQDMAAQNDFKKTAFLVL